MKKKEQWRENLVEALEIPRDLALKESVFTVTGKSQIQDRKLQKYPSL